jgi:SAM-dependent methyltransferase
MVASRLRADLARFAPLLSGALLDVGAGNRPYADLLSGVARYIAYDVESSQVPLDVIGHAPALPFASRSFDAVLSTQVLEHVAEPARMLTEIARVLRPGGCVLLSAPQQWRLHEQPYDYFRYTKYGLAHLFEQAGFTVEACMPQGGAWVVMGTVLINTLSRPRFRRRSPLWFFDRGIVTILAFLINVMASAFDRVWPDSDDTLNYVVYARRVADAHR